MPFCCHRRLVAETAIVSAHVWQKYSSQLPFRQGTRRKAHYRNEMNENIALTEAPRCPALCRRYYSAFGVEHRALHRQLLHGHSRGFVHRGTPRWPATYISISRGSLPTPARAADSMSYPAGIPGGWLCSDLPPSERPGVHMFRHRSVMTCLRKSNLVGRETFGRVREACMKE